MKFRNGKWFLEWAGGKTEEAYVESDAVQSVTGWTEDEWGDWIPTWYDKKYVIGERHLVSACGCARWVPTEGNDGKL